MNQNQKRIVVAVIVIIAGMLAYPPFHVVANNGTVFNMGYGWIVDPPKRGYITATVNVAMLLIQWVGILIVGGLAFFLAKSAQQESGAPSSNFRSENLASKETQAPAGVRGWLLLLVVGMMALGPLLGAARINADIMMEELQYPVLTSLSEWSTFKSAIWWTFLGIAVLSFYGGLGLARGKGWSVVNRAKAILWISGPAGSLVMSVLIPVIVFGELLNAVDAQSVGAFIASVLAASIWTTYLMKSKRVRNTYGGSVPSTGAGNEIISPPIDNETQPATQSDPELMAEYGISFDGERYHFENYRYAKLADAVNYAKLQRSRSKDSDQ